MLLYLPQAAVSPPSSGLLGCDQVNFNKLMASKARNNSPLPNDPQHPVPFGTSAPTHTAQMMGDHVGGPHRTTQKSSGREPSDEDMEDEDMGAGDDSSELDLTTREDAYGLNSGGDVMADMVRCAI